MDGNVPAPYQSVLDRYLAGQVSEQELLEQSRGTTKGGAFPGNTMPLAVMGKQLRL